MMTVPRKVVRLERMLDYRVVGLQRFHCKQLDVLLSYFQLLWLAALPE